MNASKARDISDAANVSREFLVNIEQMINCEASNGYRNLSVTLVQVSVSNEVFERAIGMTLNLLKQRGFSAEHNDGQLVITW